MARLFEPSDYGRHTCAPSFTVCGQLPETSDDQLSSHVDSHSLKMPRCVWKYEASRRLAPRRGCYATSSLRINAILDSRTLRDAWRETRPRRRPPVVGGITHIAESALRFLIGVHVYSFRLCTLLPPPLLHFLPGRVPILASLHWTPLFFLTICNERCIAIPLRANTLVWLFWTRDGRPQRAPIAPGRTRVKGLVDPLTMHVRRSRVCFASISPLSPSLSISHSPVFSRPFILLSRFFPGTRRVPCIAFRSRFNRSCWVEWAKWSCMLGDKWEIRSSLERLSVDKFIRSRARDPGRSDWSKLASRDWFAYAYMYVCARILRIHACPWKSRYLIGDPTETSAITVVHKV